MKWKHQMDIYLGNNVFLMARAQLFYKTHIFCWRMEGGSSENEEVSNDRSEVSTQS